MITDNINLKDANDPSRFYDLDLHEQSSLVEWIKDVLAPAKNKFRRSSYSMKHDFQREPDGFYIYNGAFKGAMLAAGFDPVDAKIMNWYFRVKPLRPLRRTEKRDRGLFGPGWLVRSGRTPR